MGRNYHIWLYISYDFGNKRCGEQVLWICRTQKRQGIWNEHNDYPIIGNVTYMGCSSISQDRFMENIVVSNSSSTTIYPIMGMNSRNLLL